MVEPGRRMGIVEAGRDTLGAKGLDHLVAVPPKAVMEDGREAVMGALKAV